MMKATDEWRQAFEIRVPRNEHNALLSARNCNQRIVEKRRPFVQRPPTVTSGASSKNAAALSKSRAGRPEDAATPFKRLKDTQLHCARRLRGPCASGEFLHHDGAEVCEWKRPAEKGKHLGLRVGASETVDENVRVQRVLHAFRRRSSTSSTPLLRRIAANPCASS